MRTAAAAALLWLASNPAGTTLAQAHFLRGDSNHDKQLNLSDCINTLSFLFLGKGVIPCLDAADANDTGDIDITDPIFLLPFFFWSGPPPPEPFSTFEADPTVDDLGCLGPPVDITSDITQDTSWTRDKVYLLRGLVRVRPETLPQGAAPPDGPTLTIEEGTTVLGERSERFGRSILVVERGAKLVAVGTESHPVVFTSAKPPGKRNLGDWGGLIILGRGDLNIPGKEGVIECLPAVAYGGGENFEPWDSSGRLSHIRVEYAAGAICPEHTLAAITLAAVGSNTFLDHIECRLAGHIGIDVVGGEPHLSFCLVSNVAGTGFRIRDGWAGNGQFWIVHQSSATAGSVALEVESSNLRGGGGLQDQPITGPRIANVTLFSAPGLRATPRTGILVHRGAGCRIVNAIVQGYGGVGLDIDDRITCEQNYSEEDDASNLMVRSSVFYANGPNGNTHWPPVGSEASSQDESLWDDPPGDEPPPCKNISEALVKHPTSIIADESPTVDADNAARPDFRAQNDALVSPFDPVQWGLFYFAAYRGAVGPDGDDWTRMRWISFWRS